MPQTLYRLLGFLGCLLALVVLVIAIEWPTITRWVIRSDLRHYAQQVRGSSLSLPEKIKLLDRIEAISDRIDAGSNLSHGRWLEADQAVREMLAEGVTEDEVVLIDRELGRVEGRLED